MLVAYLDCFSGIAGDMLVAALLDAGLSFDELRQALAKVPVHGYELECPKVQRCSLSARRFIVRITRAEHTHRGLGEVLEILGAGDLSEQVLRRAERVFRLLAGAEAAAHGIDVEQVHFHEVGAVDSILDVVAACWGLERLGVEQVHASALELGGGSVDCAHGQLPAPAPGALGALQGQPVVVGSGAGELTTPTGAALVGALAESVGEPLALRLLRVGHGAGARDIPGRANILRVILGEIEHAGVERETLIQLETNLDQSTPENLAYALERLLAAGALDAWFTPVVMKKGRPGQVLALLARPEDRLALEAILYRETSTLGVRCSPMQRSKLARRILAVQTDHGTVHVKERTLPDGQRRYQPEYEDVRKVAEECGRPFAEIWAEVQRRAVQREGD